MPDASQGVWSLSNREDADGTARLRDLAQRDVPLSWLTRVITVVVLLCLAVIAVADVVAASWTTQPVVLAASLTCIVAIFGVQVVLTSSGPRRWSPRGRVPALGLQALLTFLPLVGFGASWVGMGGPLAGSILVMTSGWRGWGLGAAVAGSVTVVPLLHGEPVVEAAFVGVTTVLTGVVVAGLARLDDLAAAARANRAELVSAAVAHERLRLARDLHDLLGYSLSAITLKCEVVHRLLPDDPRRAQDEAAAALVVAREALADVRTMADRPRTLSLAHEAGTIGSVLATAGIDVEVAVPDDPLPTHVDTVLATVLREGVTNILRHSAVRRCSITTRVRDGECVLEIVNDGVVDQPPAATADEGGSGLRSLGDRVAHVGGRLSAGPRDGGRYHLVACVPLAPVPGDDVAGAHSLLAVDASSLAG